MIVRIGHQRRVAQFLSGPRPEAVSIPTNRKACDFAELDPPTFCWGRRTHNEGRSSTTPGRGTRCRIAAVGSRLGLALAIAFAAFMPVGELVAQREVSFPPPDAKPPPPLKSPPRTQSSGEETSIIPNGGPTMRKTQERVPPPPTTLTVMVKLKYGEKLQYVYPDGRIEVFEQWQSFKDDGYHITRHTNTRLADGNNYQYATKALSSQGFDPVDIPLLYMTGDYHFTFTEAEVTNLRKFLVDGGTILFNASRGHEEFSESVVREMRRVLPSKTFMRAPLDHPIYNNRYRIKQVLVIINGIQRSSPPEVYTLDIGTRSAAILIPVGMSAAWSGSAYDSAGRHLIGESGIRMGVNLLAYVLGNTEYGRFLAQEFPVYDGATQPGDVLRFAQVQYTGSWDVNPVLQNSMMQGLTENTGIGVDYSPHVIELSDPEIGHYPIVFMTGHYDFSLSNDEIENLKGYLRKGGTLIASSAAGFKAFDIAFRREIERALPDAELIKLPPSHPLFAAGWSPVKEVEYTPMLMRDDPTLKYPEFYGVFIENRLSVLYTPYDFKSALNRESNAYAKGLTSSDALKIAINIITHVMSH